MASSDESPTNGSRRDFVRRGLYVAPAILTLAAAPEFAKAGSVSPTPPVNGPGRGRGPGDDHPGRGGGILGDIRDNVRDILGGHNRRP